ncbi:MAG: aminoacyl-histidine dipeptidase [Eubacteriales bacterium]
MRKLKELQPSSVFYYFEDICNIPHGSGNIEQMSNYLVDFAKKHSLEHVQDEVKNVIIFKKASIGYEEQDPMILQSHMDMVTVKKSGSTIDLEKDGIDVQVDGDCIYAIDTSLGGDNGIGMAYTLALLAGIDVEHPPLECIFTVDEEVGMDGATALDLSMLKGTRLMNIDSEEEGILLASCAGGSKVSGRLLLEQGVRSGCRVKITLSGCKGGHSGVEIHTGRANAAYVCMRCLLQLEKEISFGIFAIEGGLKDNAIPQEASATIIMETEDLSRLEEILEKMTATLAKEYYLKEEGMKVSYSLEESDIVTSKMTTTSHYSVVQDEELKRLFSFLLNQPNGVISMSSTMEGVVETSLNLGILTLKDGELLTCYAVRSNIDSAREALVDRMVLLIGQLGGTCIMGGEYPAWEYMEESKLRERMKRVYMRLYGTQMQVQGVHAGLECGILCEKIEGLDCVSVGPNMEGIHTTEEKFSISSVERMWSYLLEVLKEKE